METIPTSPVTVFISYAHEPNIFGHREAALALAQSLRLDGIAATIDQYVEQDPPYWPRWMINRVRDSDFVLCLASPTYKERFEQEGDPLRGRGARWEGAVITEEMYRRDDHGNSKFIAILLEGRGQDEIPDLLMPLGRTHYVLPAGYEELCRRLTGQRRVTPAPLGPLIRFDS